jgi:hypothetical protein
MNIQDTIKELGLELDKLPRILSQRVATVEDLVTKVEQAEKNVSENPNEESEAELKEIKEYTAEYYKDAVEQLENYKGKLDKKAEEEAKQEAEKEKVNEVEAEAEVVEAKAENEKSSGLGTLLIGGALLIATLGAVNILRKR